jgi:hypothetical protein
VRLLAECGGRCNLWTVDMDSTGSSIDTTKQKSSIKKLKNESVLGPNRLKTDDDDASG